MKKLFTLFVVCLVAISAAAQEHLTVKGVSMGGTLNSVITQLKKSGLSTSLYSTADSPVLEGSFAGISGCRFVFGATDDGKLVYRIGIMTPFERSWSSVKSTYESLKSSYTAKYGEPKSFEYFINPYELGDGYELQALSLDKCVYQSYYFIEGGAITIEMSGTSSRQGYVVITYEDSANLEKAQSDLNVIINEEI